MLLWCLSITYTPPYHLTQIYFTRCGEHWKTPRFLTITCVRHIHSADSFLHSSQKCQTGKNAPQLCTILPDSFTFSVQVWVVFSHCNSSALNAHSPCHWLISVGDNHLHNLENRFSLPHFSSCLYAETLASIPLASAFPHVFWSDSHSCTFGKGSIRLFLFHVICSDSHAQNFLKGFTLSSLFIQFICSQPFTWHWEGIHMNFTFCLAVFSDSHAHNFEKEFTWPSLFAFLFAQTGIHVTLRKDSDGICFSCSHSHSCDS